MADFSLYWTYKQVEKSFLRFQSVNLQVFLDNIKECLTEDDLKTFEMLLKKEFDPTLPMEMIYLILFHRLTKHWDWKQVLTKACTLDSKLDYFEKLFPRLSVDTGIQPRPPTYFKKAIAKCTFLCQLMMTVCVDLFRDVLDYYIQPAQLKTELPGICEYLESIMNCEQRRFLKLNMWLSNYMSDEGNAMPLITKDLSLLYILIRFICNIPPPQTGWGSRPENDDKSLAACIERIRILGKTILDHSEETKEILESDFKDMLKDLRTNISEIQEMVFKKYSYAHAVDELFSLDITLSERYILDFKNLTSEEDTISPFAVIQYYPDRETENLFRVCTLIHTISSDLFRDTLCRFVNPATLEFGDHIAEVLPSNCLLFFYNYLRKNCGISQHKCGWGFLPDTNDHSLAACIDRLMIQRNTIAASMKSGISESNFQEIWRKLRDDIKEIEQQVIGGNAYEQRVHDLFSMPINQVFAVKYVAEKVHAMSYWDLARNDSSKGTPEESSLPMKSDDSEAEREIIDIDAFNPKRFTGDVSRSPQVLSREQAELLKSIDEVIVQKFPNDSFVGNIFEEKGLTHVGKEIKSLSKEVSVLHNPNIYQRTRSFKPGAVLIYEVEVAFQNGDFNITKENTVSAENFLRSRRDYNPRVILVKSDPALKEYAKSFVFRKYRDVISMGNTFVQHETDNCQFSKLSGIYSASFICDQVRLLTEVKPPESIVYFGNSTFLTRKFISQICYGVILKKDNLDVGSVEHATYLCTSHKSLNQLRQNLEEQTIHKICSSLKFKYNLGCITSHILEKILLKAVADLRSEDIDICKAKVALPVDVNSKEWRLGVAEALYTLIMKKTEVLTNPFKELYQELQSNIELVCARIESYKNLCHQNSLSEYTSRGFPYIATWFQRWFALKLCIIEQFPIQSELSKVLLNVVHFEEELGYIRSMAMAEKEEILRSEILQIFKVNVFNEENQLTVVEKNPSQRKQFFSEAYDHTARVIWIHSKSVPVIEAKLCVYQRYKNNLKARTIWMYHDYDEHLDEIRKLSVLQKLKSLRENILSICDICDISRTNLEAELKKIFTEILSEENVCSSFRKVVLEVGIFLGAADEETIKKYSKEITESFCLQICQKTIISLKERAQTKLHCLEDILWTNQLNSFIVKSSTFFTSIERCIFATLMEINARFETGFAHAFYDSICHEKYVFRVVPNELYCMLKMTQKELFELTNCIKTFETSWALPNSEKLVEDWTKREIIQNRNELLTEFPSILTMLAGERDGKSFVKVFLRDIGKKPSKEHLRIFFSISPDVEIDFANVTEECEKNKNIQKTTRKHKEINPLSKEERYLMESMLETIQKYDVLLMANHSNLVGIGVSRILDDETRFGQPCIVFHCIDKTIIPFGERMLPKFLEGYPVELKESIFDFAYCQNCPALNNGCSIGRLGDNQSSGSVGFFVRNRTSPSDRGFLTAAHVVFSKYHLTMIYDSCDVFDQHTSQSSHHNIVHPSLEDSNNVSVIGYVHNARLGNVIDANNQMSPIRGIDAAFVKSAAQTIQGNILQPVDEKDIDLFVTRVTKMGRTTGHTTGLYTEFGTYRMNEKYLPGRDVYFNGSYIIEDLDTTFSQGGDSGAGVLIEGTDKALGLLIGRSEKSPLTLVCDIQNTMQLFDLDLYRRDLP